MEMHRFGFIVHAALFIGGLSIGLFSIGPHWATPTARPFNPLLSRSAQERALGGPIDSTGTNRFYRAEVRSATQDNLIMETVARTWLVRGLRGPRRGRAVQEKWTVEF